MPFIGNVNKFERGLTVNKHARTALFRYFTNEIYFRLGRAIAVMLFASAVILSMSGKKISAARLIMKSHRIRPFAATARYAMEAKLLCEEFLSPNFSDGVSLSEAAGRTIVLQYPKIANGNLLEKGIIVIAFTRTFGFYLRNIDIDLLSEHFSIVLEPSWSGYMDADILGWIYKTRRPVYVQATELTDRATLAAFGSNLIPLTFGASDWVDFKRFEPRDGNKIYDSIYVANTNPIKRTVRYVNAIRRIVKTRPPYKGCLVCASWGGGGKEELMQLVRHFGLGDNLDVFFSLKQTDLSLLLDNCKTNVLLSYKEGSNRSLFEAMYVNVPVICISENIGTNKAYFNEFTGMVVGDAFLESALIEMSEKWQDYRPRYWAINNISPIVTTKKLVDVICAREGREVDPAHVYVKTNNPELSYFDYPDVRFVGLTEGVISAFLLSNPNRKSSVISELHLLASDFAALFEMRDGADV